MSEQAPFIPSAPDEEPIPPPSSSSWQVFRAPGFPRLFAAQIVSSIGDWTGLVAILALAARVSSSGTATGLVMIARMLPGFILAPIGGALVDRWNRKVVMVSCDIGRACLIAVLPFWNDLAGLVIISFCIEVLTLLWGPAKDASVPNIVKDPEQLPAANSLGLVAAFGMFPVGAVIFALLAAVSSWLGNFSALARFGVEQESLALWVDAFTFLVSALLISGLHLPRVTNGGAAGERAAPRETFRDVVEGLKFIRSNPIVRGVMVGLAGGLLGGGAIVPLGALYAKDVLAGTASAYGFLTTALGVGAALGVVTLLWLQRRLQRERVFVVAVIITGGAIIGIACLSVLGPAILVVGCVGAGAGCAYVTGFTLLQEHASDEMRGRMFATLYTVVRVALLLSLTVMPFVAGAFNAVVEHFTGASRVATIGGIQVYLPGVRLALLLGGVVTVLSGMAARRRMHKAHLTETQRA